jgi:signal transduction histidine kinase
MKKDIAWSRWSIVTKILVIFLGLSAISMGTIGYIALANIRALGSYALETSTMLGESAIQDSTAHLNNLGEEIIKQKARDVATQIGMYLEHRPVMTLAEMRSDAELRQIVVQLVGTTGYTTLIDPVNAIIIIHKFPGQEKDISPLKDILPSFWELIETSISGNETSGYYDWLEVDGSIRQKYASIAPIKTAGGVTLTLWATTYIDEFSKPAEETKKEINAAILESGKYINDSVSRIQDIFAIVFTALVIAVIGLALLLSRVITNPILALQRGAEAIGQGKLDYKLVVKNRDELGDLANSFNKMALALKNYMEELENTAAENIAQEKRIQDNLRLYSQKVGEAQEAERKRIARELHDETAQALVVVSRHLDDLALGDAKLSIADIRKEVQKIFEGVRHFSQELRPSVLDDLGLVPAVQWLASDLTKNYGINVSTEITGNPRALPPAAELMLFRITQEALTNVRKHSQATSVSVKINFSDHNIRVTVQDNGKGFVMPKGMGDLTRTGRLGLAGMQERAQLLGGILNIQSEPGKGSTLTIEVPL